MYVHAYIQVRGAASVIGAVNTVVPEVVQSGWAGLVSQRTTKLIGFNTDWLGMLRPILRKLKQRGLNWSNENSDMINNIGVVVGAGGTARAACYAVKELGLDLIVINRSAEKGKELAKMFGGKFLADLSVTSLESIGIFNFNTKV